MLSVLLVSSIMQTAPEVELLRKFSTGTTQNYSVHSHIISEIKEEGMSFFLPMEFDLKYAFSIKVEEARKDGFAVVLYQRPTMTFVDGETADHPPRTKDEKVDYKVRMTLSPINEITDVTDLNPKKKESNKGFKVLTNLTKAPRQDGLFSMIQEVRSLAMFSGNLDSSLDFSPKLPLEEVKTGDTWKKTVSYQPRELKGTGKQAVQRLDYTFTFEGLQEWNAKKAYVIRANLDLDTDAAKFIHQITGTNPETTGLKEVRLKLKNDIKFYLDEKTFSTMFAEAVATGGFKIVASDQPDEPVYEEKVTGKSTLKLLSAP
ncbi:MAG: hypothetical protein JNM34_01145 [Chthonomonadaceae bacterium]|nr:hypothetical protein [Chthonomonadaceae bacterium]